MRILKSKIQIAITITLIGLVFGLTCLIYILRPPLWGFIDRNGKVVVSPDFENAFSGFSGQPEWPALVKQNGRWQYVDRTGRRVIDQTFSKSQFEVAPKEAPSEKNDFASEFQGGFAKVRMNGRIGIIDKKGTVTYSEDSAMQDPFTIYSEGLARVRNKDGRYGYQDKQGNVVIAPQFFFAEDFREGLAKVQTRNGIGFIDKSGKIAIQEIYEDASYFTEGLAPVCKNKLWGYIDKTGKILIPPQFSNATNFSEGLAYVNLRKIENGHDILKWAYIDKTGHFVIGPRDTDGYWELSNWYPMCTEFSEGLAAVHHLGHYGYINKTGDWVIEPQFSRPGRFSDGIAIVRF